MKILLAMDGSDASMTAAAALSGLSIPDSSTIQILHVVPGEKEIYSGLWPTIILTPSAEETGRARDEIRERLESVADSLAADGRTTSVKLVEGRPASRIIEEAQQMSADLVVVGAHGLSAVERRLIGSVSSEVVDHAPCPVLVARSDRAARVLMATDGSADGDRAADFVATSRLFESAELRVISVIDPGMPWWAGVSAVDGRLPVEAYNEMIDIARKHADEAARRTAERLGTGYVTVDPAEGSGDVPSTILAEAGVWKSDIIVVGTRGHGMVKRTLLGSVSRDVLHHAPMSVLIVG